MRCSQCEDNLFDEYCECCDGESSTSEEKEPTQKDIMKMMSNSRYRKSHKKFGKLLISGSGREYAQSSAAAMSWLIVFILAALIMIGCAVAANIFGYETHTVGGSIGREVAGLFGFGSPDITFRTNVYYIILFGGFITVSAMIIATMILHRHGSKTKIWVFKDGIVGEGADEGLSSGSISSALTGLSSFQLGYDKIASVDIKNKNYFIHQCLWKSVCSFSSKS